MPGDRAFGSADGNDQGNHLRSQSKRMRNILRFSPLRPHERLLLAFQLCLTASSLIGSLLMRDSLNEFLFSLYFLAFPVLATLLFALGRLHFRILLALTHIFCFALIAYNTLGQPFLPLIFSLNREGFTSTATEIKSGAERKELSWIGSVPVLNVTECREGVACFRISNGGGGATIVAATPCASAPFNAWLKVDLEPGWCWIHED